MKKILLLALSAMVCFGSAKAQLNHVSEDGNFGEIDDFSLVNDSSSASSTVDAVQQQFTPQLEQMASVFSMLQGLSALGQDVGKVKEEIYPLGKGLFKKHHIEQAIEISPNITKSKVSQADVLQGQSLDDINETGLSMNFGYSVIFIPGKEKDGKLHLNKAGFAYNLGFLASVTTTDRYGTTCDFLGKVGVETCHNRKLGIGLDFLGGYGKSQGDVFFYTNIVEDSEPTSISPYTSWGWKFGGQLYVKTNLLGNSLSGNADVLLFVRFIKAVDPEIMAKVSPYSYNIWREENWSFGATLRYRM